MTSSITSFPVPPRDHKLARMLCPTKEAKPRRPKRRHKTTDAATAKPQNGAHRKLITTTSGNVKVFDTLVYSSDHLKPSTQQSARKPANKTAAGKRPSDYWLEMDPEGGGKRCVVIREMFLSLFEASDNKLAMKLFGNRNALMKERLRQRASNSWVIHPCSDFRCVTFMGKNLLITK